jgi:hypothetical protein
VSLSFAAVGTLVAWNDLGRKPGLFHAISILLVFLAIEVFLIWKVWVGKNWARLTLLAFFVLDCIQIFVWHTPPPVPLHVPASMEIVGIVLTILQAISFVTLFTNPAREWFRGPQTA